MKQIKQVLVFILLSLSLVGCKKASFSFTLSEDTVKNEMIRGEAEEVETTTNVVSIADTEHTEVAFTVGNTHKLICKGVVLSDDSTGLHSTDVYTIGSNGGLEQTSITDDLSQNSEAVVKFVSDTDSEANITALLYIKSGSLVGEAKTWEQWEISESLKEAYKDAVLQASMIEAKNIIYRQITGVKHEEATKGGEEPVTGQTEFSIMKDCDYGKSVRAFVKIDKGDSFDVGSQAEKLLDEMLSKLEIFEAIEHEVMEISTDRLEDLIMFSGSKVERGSLGSLLVNRNYSTASNYSAITLVPSESKVIQLKRENGQAEEDKLLVTVKNTGTEVISLMDSTVIRIEVVFDKESQISEDFVLLGGMTGGSVYEDILEVLEGVTSSSFDGNTGAVTKSMIDNKVNYELTVYFTQGSLYSFTLLSQ